MASPYLTRFKNRLKSRQTVKDSPPNPEPPRPLEPSLPDPSNPPVDPFNSPFLRLPEEIRQQIYREAFIGEHSHLIHIFRGEDARCEHRQLVYAPCVCQDELACEDCCNKKDLAPNCTRTGFHMSKIPHGECLKVLRMKFPSTCRFMVREAALEGSQSENDDKSDHEKRIGIRGKYLPLLLTSRSV
jgi:hypothetical protein